MVCFRTIKSVASSYRRGVLKLLVSTVMGNFLRPSIGGASNGYSLHVIFIMGNTKIFLSLITNPPNLESIGIELISYYENDKFFCDFLYCSLVLFLRESNTRGQ